ncbi:MAG: CoA-binding protein, partial [Pseudomonadota bacterium]
MAGQARSLGDAVFTPKSIGLIGLSSDPATPAGRVLGFLRRNGCQARIVIVNPRRHEVQGEPAYTSLAACPEVPEHAYLLLGHDRVETALTDCAAAGVRVCTVLADGFAEAGAGGAAKQDRLVAIARDAG